MTVVATKDKKELQGRRVSPLLYLLPTSIPKNALFLLGFCFHTPVRLLRRLLSLPGNLFRAPVPSLTAPTWAALLLHLYLFHGSCLAGTLAKLSLHCVTVSCLPLSLEYELLRAGTRSISIFLFIILASSTVPSHTAGIW